MAKEAFLTFLELLPARLNPLTSLFYRDEPALLGWEILHVPQWIHLSPLDDQLIQSISTFLIDSRANLAATPPIEPR